MTVQVEAVKSVDQRDPGDGRTWSARLPAIREATAALLLYVLLALLLTIRAWDAPATHWIGSCCDQEQSMWFLRWIPYALAGGQSPFVTGQLNAPDGVNLMWNASMPLVGTVMAPVTLAAGPLVAYNVAIVAAIATSGWACFLALRRFTEGLLGPLVGGAVYAMSPYVASHAALHLNLVVVWAPPAFLILFHELVVRDRYSPRLVGVLLGVVAGLQLLTFEELLATSAVSAAVLAGILAIVVHDRALIIARGGRMARAVIPAAAAFLALGAWPLAVQFLGPQRVSGRLLDSADFATDLLNLVLPTKYQQFAPAAATAISDHFSVLFHEATGYVGLPLLLVIALGAGLRWSDLRLRVATIAAVAMFVLSLGPSLRVGGADTGIPMPWLPFSVLPLLEHALPGRLTLYMWLAIALIVAVIIERLATIRRSRAVPGLAVLGLALAFAAPATLTSSTTSVPAFFASWDRQGIGADAIVLAAPYFTDGAGAAPMLWAAVAGDAPRLYEAYAYVPGADGRPRYGPEPTRLSGIMEAIQDGDGSYLVARGPIRAQALGDLANAGITHVIVGPMKRQAQMVAFFTDLLGRPPVEVDGVQLWRGPFGSG